MNRRLHLQWLPAPLWTRLRPRLLSRVVLALSIWRGWPDPWRGVRLIMDDGWSLMPNLAPWQRAMIDAYDPWADIDWPLAWSVAGESTR